MAGSIEGLPALNRRLQRLDASMERKVIHAALAPAAKLLRDALKTATPKKSGNLRKSIRIKDTFTKVEGVRRIVGVKVGPGASKTHPGYHAHLVEFGTKPHVIRAGTRRGKATTARYLGSKGRGFGAVVHHPGSRPRPFVIPTYRAKKGEMARLIQQHAGDQVRVAWTTA